MSTVLLFSGQGSQYFQMGRELFEQERTFREYMQYYDARLREACGMEVLPLIYGKESPSTPFLRTRFSHLALYLIQYSLAKTVADWGLYPSGVMGVSVGETCAAAVAGALAFEEGARALLYQAQLLEYFGCSGTMLAVLAGAERTLEVVGAEPYASSGVCIAADNSSENCVLSGTREGIDRARLALQKAQITTSILPVEYGFHSAEVEPLRSEYLSLLSTLRKASEKLEIWSAATGRKLSSFTPGHLWTAVREPIRLRSTWEALIAADYESYWDMSPSGTLANSLRRNLPAEKRERVVHLLDPLSSLSRVEAARRRIAHQPRGAA